ncbi:MAG: HlyC/CorC family transporter [Verrucomicrobia bacterium]|nr:HlyC/CorC family transporter [Verrucomicrobiota bacterium]
MLLTAVLAVLFFAAASFFFALAESALFSLGKWRARQLAERSPARGGLVVKLLEQPQDALATILLGNTFANAALVAVALWVALPERNWPLSLTVAMLLAVILIGCEVIPKTLAVRVPEEWALRVAGPMFTLTRLTRPLRQVALRISDALVRTFAPGSLKPLQSSADEEYRELLDLAFQQGTLAAAEKEIILQIISLDRRTARDVMQPRAKMACLSDDLTVTEMIVAAKKFQHRRLPLYDETPDTIVGILNTRTLLLNPDGDLADAVEFPSYVPESMNLLQLLKSFQRQQRGLAIVLDEFGGTAGLVTVEDILEKMIGAIRGEAQPAGFIMEKLGPDRWRVNGTMRLEDFRREYPELGEVPEVDTMGGLLLAQMEVVPAPGDAVIFRGLRLTAKAADERCVREVLVERVFSHR